VQVGTTITLDGSNRGLFVTADGTRAVVSSSTDDPGATSLAVVDLVTGTQLGDTVTVPGYAYVYNSSVNSDGTRIVVDSYNYDNADTTHRVLVVDTVTGNAETYALFGKQQGAARFTPDGTKIIIDTFDDTYDYSNPGVYENRTTVIALT
jgi:Tol biopolymer transport system component